MNILLTGSSGVVGSRVLFDLIRHNDVHIFCLSREPDKAKFFEKLVQLLSLYGGADDEVEPLLKEKITIVIGDVSKEKMGIESSEYKTLTQCIDVVCHLAAYVNLLSPYIKSRPINEIGTLHVTQFCLEGNIPLLYASSYSIIGDKAFEEGFVFYEKDLDVGQNFKGLGYQESKVKAEKIIQNSAQKGLKYQILRLGDVYGDQNTGAYPLEQTTLRGVYYDVFKTVTETGFSWSREDYYDISPVDVVAKVITKVILDHIFENKVYHVLNPDRKTFNQIMGFISEFGYNLEFVDLKKYLQAVRSKKLIFRGVPYFSPAINVINYYEEVFRSKIDNNLKMQAKFDQQHFSAFCEKYKIEFPKVDQSLIAKLLTFCIDHKHIKPAAEQKYKAEFK